MARLARFGMCGASLAFLVGVPAASGAIPNAKTNKVALCFSSPGSSIRPLHVFNDQRSPRACKRRGMRQVKINRRGRRGRVGAQGRAGAQGPVGPRGPVGPHGSPGPATGPAGGALAGGYPNPRLNVSGGPCANGEALTDVSDLAALSCSPGVYWDDDLGNVGAGSNLEGTTGSANSALGWGALQDSTAGSRNSAVGYEALASNVGIDNSALGWAALFSNTTGIFNTAVGSAALEENIDGGTNTAVGHVALQNNTHGGLNSALGYGALNANTMGSVNTAVGTDALGDNTTGSGNVALGPDAGRDRTTGDDNIDIGAGVTGVGGESNTIRIGDQGTQDTAFLAGVSGTNLGAQPAVVVNSDGQLGVEASSRRFKTDIHSIGSMLDRLMDLRPISFRYKPADVSGSNPRQFGLLAEEVAKVYPDLVASGRDGRPYTVLYQQLPVLLLAQVQKQQRQSDALRTQIRDQQAQIDWLMKQVRDR
jgi:hypothetical protein